MVPLKRRKVSSHTQSSQSTQITVNRGDKVLTLFPEVVLFLLERKMGSSRRAFLSELGRRKGFQVEDTFSKNEEYLLFIYRFWVFMGFLPVYRLFVFQDRQINEAEVAEFSVPTYACQRRTTLENHNAVLTDALSLLAEHAELSDEDGRGVAFRRAAAVLKALPKPVTSVKQLRGLPCLGDHSLRIIKDILENRESSEVQSTKQSERFKALKVLTGIFGVGAKTADRWIRDGINNLQQLQDSGQTLNRAQQAGLQHYDHLSQPVTKQEADAIGEIVEEAVASVLPGARITLIGGFRRGKLTGHDVDFLITHPEEGREVGLMPKVVSWLESKGFLLYQKTTRNSYLESKDGPARPASNMDRFERCFSIFKLPEEEKPAAKHPETLTGNVEQSLPLTSSHVSAEGEALKRWRAVRVDLVVSPISQFAFALLGWTGSKLFERELRRWAGHEKAMSLSSHALYDNKQVETHFVQTPSVKKKRVSKKTKTCSSMMTVCVLCVCVSVYECFDFMFLRRRRHVSDFNTECVKQKFVKETRRDEKTTIYPPKDTAAMRGHFSIEWMAQSSQPAGTEAASASGPTTCGTHSESLPGFYCRQKTENVQELQETRNQSPESFSLNAQNSHSSQVSEVGFSSGTEEETSGYESEGGRSLSPLASADCASSSSPASPPSGRRPRTAFTPEQISSMERAFKRNAYLGTQDKTELCKKLNLSDKQIRNWFQNRRMKLKRSVQDALAQACQANMASQLLHYPELQAYRPGPYPRYHSAAGQDGQAAASYVHPHGLQYAAPLPSVPSLPLDSFYQYGSLPGVMLPPTSTPLMGSYPTYPQYY
ncbi:hypothetical protein L3Q82_012749 [Scortum barcoo]|uniref:Uncharacterized protein n=1 Tax=Scortum barcoo TaxID=214431 RepID=A0ACB8W5H1_9TELE|nr:hypothetical protein L3Q82_012749 [Scortum barcoo]